MSDNISREAAIKAFEEARYDVSEPYGNDGFSFDKVENVLQSIPAADVKPVVRGKWVTDEYGNFVCSECGKEPFYDDLGFGYICSDFCPDCGADMREEKKNG